MAVVLSTVFSFYSAVAVWAGLSRRHWFVRAAGVVAGLALLLPARAYAPAVLFLLHAGIVIASLAALRFLQARRGGDRQNHRRNQSVRFRFRLSDILLAIVIVGAMTAMGAHLLRQPMRFEWLSMVLTSVSTAASTLAAAWLALGRSRLLARLIVFALAVAAGGACWHWYDWTGLAFFVSLTYPELAGPLICSMVFLAWLLLWRLAGFSPKPPNLSAALSTPRWLRRLSQATLILLVPAVSLAMLFVYRELTRPLRPKEVMTANPNGYDDLLRAAERLRNAQVLQVLYAEERTPAAAAAFVKNHKAALEEIRTGLSRKCQVPLSYSPDDSLFDLCKLRELAHALDIEAEVAVNEGRTADAARIGLDCMRLGNEVSRGGLVMFWCVGSTAGSYGFHRIAEVRHSLSADECREVVEAIQVIDSERESLDAIQQRDRTWAHYVYGWPHTFSLAVHALAGVTHDVALTECGIRDEAATGLLQTELAVQAFQLEHGRYPERLDELVPDYLRQFPIDPYCDKPLVYRREGEEYRLNSVGPNGVDDGGQRVSLEQSIEGEGDVFLATLMEQR